MKKIDYSKRGPLIKVQIGPGRFVKMYERDAIARGLVKKERPQVPNKMMVPDEDKNPAPKTPDQDPSPLALNPPGASHPTGSSSQGERSIDGDGDVVEVKRGKRKRTPHPGQIPSPNTPHPSPQPSGASLPSGSSSQGEGEEEE